MLLEYVVLKLGASLRNDFRVNPRDQNMEPIQCVFARSNLPPLALPKEKQFASSLVAIYRKIGGTVSPSSVKVIYTSSLTKNLIIAKNFDVPEWDKLAPFCTIPNAYVRTPSIKR